MLYRVFFDIDVKWGEVFVSTDDKQSVITSATCIHNLKFSMNGKGGDCWNYDWYCDDPDKQIRLWCA